MLRLAPVSGCSGSKRLLADRQRPLEKRLRSRIVALSLKQAREVVEAHGRIGMLGSQRLLVDRQRPLVKRLRPRIVALSLKQDREVVEARGRIGMLGSQRLLADRQRPLEKRLRFRIGGAAMKIAACTLQKLGALRGGIPFQLRRSPRHAAPASHNAAISLDFSSHRPDRPPPLPQRAHPAPAPAPPPPAAPPRPPAPADAAGSRPS